MSCHSKKCYMFKYLLAVRNKPTEKNMHFRKKNINSARVILKWQLSIYEGKLRRFHNYKCLQQTNAKNLSKCNEIRSIFWQIGTRVAKWVAEKYRTTFQQPDFFPGQALKIPECTLQYRTSGNSVVLVTTVYLFIAYYVFNPMF